MTPLGPSPLIANARHLRVDEARAAVLQALVPVDGIDTVSLAEAIGRILDRPVEKRFAPTRAGDIRDSWADLSAARDVLGFTPSVGLEEGLRHTVVAALASSPEGS